MTSNLHSVSRLAAPLRNAERATVVGTGRSVTKMQGAAEIGPFATLIIPAQLEQTTGTDQPPASAPEGTSAQTPSSAPANPSTADKAQKALEAFALQTFIEAMLPKESNRMFGSGSAGKMWQSLLAEKLAEAITASRQLKLIMPQMGKSTQERNRDGMTTPLTPESDGTIPRGDLKPALATANGQSWPGKSSPVRHHHGFESDK